MVFWLDFLRQSVLAARPKTEHHPMMAQTYKMPAGRAGCSQNDIGVLRQEVRVECSRGVSEMQGPN